MCFKNWLKKKYINDSGPKGYLARDVWMDKTFPINGAAKFNGWHEYIYDYMMKEGACYECIDIFEQCWKEYELCERKRLKMALPKQ